MAEGFLSRWSRRKAGVDEKPSESAPQPASVPEKTHSEQKPVEPEALPSPTMEDVEKIDRFAQDFSAFMQPNVDPAVQQAALKKMFTDPHFNVMDGLDIYIDDYSKPDPLTPGMLERMVQGDMLKLFQNTAGTGNEVSQNAQSNPNNSQPVESDLQSDLTSKPSLSAQKSVDMDGEQMKSDQKKT